MSSNLLSDAVTDDTVNVSYKGLKKVSRRSKQSLVIQNPKLKLLKPQMSDIVVESPYAKIQSISKPRSISGSKSKSNKTLSSCLNVSSNQSLSKIKTNQPSNLQIQNSEFLLALKHNYIQKTISPVKSSKQIEEKLFSSLKKMKESKKDSNKFEAYQTAFSEVIEKDEVYGKLLSKIKDAYEQKIKYEKIDINKDLIEKLKEDISELKEKLLKSKEDRKYFIKKIEKLARENVEISRELEDRKERYVDLQDKLIKLSKIDISEIPLNLESWKFLVNENNHLTNLCDDMKKDIKSLSKKEKKLVSLIVALKEQGFPVEEVYDSQIHRTKKNKYFCEESPKDDSENENLISAKPKIIKKPEIIPQLQLSNIKNSENESSNHSSSESEED